PDDGLVELLAVSLLRLSLIDAFRLVLCSVDLTAGSRIFRLFRKRRTANLPTKKKKKSSRPNPSSNRLLTSSLLHHSRQSLAA
ncbi:hypothetical protein LTR16_001980, partial [Cryomyces antarcticus]